MRHGHPVGKSKDGEPTALEVLADEDRAIQDLFTRIEQNRGSSVERRYQYGNLAKQLLRRLATRESAHADVAGATANVPALRSVASQMTAHDPRRRELIDRLAALSRGIQGIALNSGQDFDEPLRELTELIDREIEWELSEALPRIPNRARCRGSTPALRLRAVREAPRTHASAYAGSPMVRACACDIEGADRGRPFEGVPEGRPRRARHVAHGPPGLPGQCCGSTPHERVGVLGRNWLWGR